MEKTSGLQNINNYYNNKIIKVWTVYKNEVINGICDPKTKLGI